MGGVHDGDGDEIKVPHERGREGGVGEVVNLKGRTDLLNFSGAHDHNPIGEGEGFFLIVSDIDSGDSEVCWMRRISERSSTRILASRAERGSSSRSNLGRRAMARAKATRCC